MAIPKTGFHQLENQGFNPRLGDYETVSARIRVWHKRDGWVWDYFGEGMKEANNGTEGHDPAVRYASKDEALDAAIRLQSEHVFDPNGCGLLRARPESMTLQDLRNIYNHCGYFTAVGAIEDEELTPSEKDDLFDELERLNQEKLRRWTHPSRYPAAFNRHEF